MASRRVTQENPKTSRRAPATTPEARENQLIAAAMDLAERQLADGTASAQVMTHYLKLGSSRERLEQIKLGNENELLVAKRDMMAAADRIEALYANAIVAMSRYNGDDLPELTDGEAYDDD